MMMMMMMIKELQRWVNCTDRHCCSVSRWWSAGWRQTNKLNAILWTSTHQPSVIDAVLSTHDNRQQLTFYRVTDRQTVKHIDAENSHHW